MSSILVSTTRSPALTLVDAVFLALAVVFGLALVGLVVLARRGRRTAQRHSLTLPCAVEDAL